jgi:integrase/recombinase XerC
MSHNEDGRVASVWLFEEFLNYLEWERNLSPATLRAYEREVRSFIDFVSTELGLNRPQATTAASVRSYLAHLHARRLAPRSVGRALAALRTCFRFLVGEGVVEANPAEAVPHPRADSRSPEITDRHTIEELLENFPETPAGRRDRALFELLYAAGLRVGELVALDLGDVQLTQRLVRVRGKGRKERVVPFGRPAAGAIAAYLPERARWRREVSRDDDPLFVNQRGGRLSDRSVRRVLDDAVRRTADLNQLHPHALRHAFATHLLEAGMRVHRRSHPKGKSD